ncbi:malto-oligosyltrehalose trehalohydrolase [Nemorincola caseinilytica]|uniref:Malto-oligosyltrehalose trehalohydrolase n=1 Tax=Nemorincola caseinilytica TaxID=2054315 RepID=A0ABP8NMQ9_9BACT
MRRVKASERRIGLVYKDENAFVRVWAPMAGKVSLMIGRETVHDLEKDEFGYWTGEVAAQPGIKYRFMVDDKLLPDPASLSQPEGVHGPSQVFDTTAFTWADDNWVNPALDKYVFYELHTGVFTPEGTLSAIESKLDHLCELGITAVELMPVAQFPGERNWGYDGVFPFAVQDSYGGPEQLQQLVNKCHEKGLAVVLDVVYNHLGPEGNCLPSYGPYFTDRYKTPWGDAINFDDAWCDGVRDYFIENALMWFRDFHIDALRFDAVHAIKDLSAKHILREIREYTDELMKYTGRTHYLIVECVLNDTRFVEDTRRGGYGMDAQWNDEFHHALRVCAGNERNGYYSDISGIRDLAKAYTNAYVYDGIFSRYRRKTFGSDASGVPGNRFIVFSQNHDQVGNRMLGERTGMLVPFEMQKLLAGAVMVAPYLPLLFMGEEWGCTTPFQYFIHHGDKELINAVREGRRKEFEHFFSEENCPDPQAEETFMACKVPWEELQQPQHALLMRYYRMLLSVRMNTPALYVLNRDNVNVVVDERTQTLMLHRWHDMQHVICVMNFSDMPQLIQVPWQLPALSSMFDSASIEWGGPGESDLDGGSIVIRPHSIGIYNDQNV